MNQQEALSQATQILNVILKPQGYEAILTVSSQRINIRGAFSTTLTIMIPDWESGTLILDPMYQLEASEREMMVEARSRVNLKS